VAVLIGVVITQGVAGQRPPPAWTVDATFYHAWARADAPVAAGATARSWLWGPEPFAVANEPWAQAVGGRRLVQYFDKARMEVNNPHADPANPYYVTNGLIVVEMVTGRVQTGEADFEARPPADVAVSGDGNDPAAPTYAGFAALLTAPPMTGLPNQRIGREGTLTPVEPPGPPDRLQPAFTDAVTQHSVPAAFWAWMNSSGPIMVGDQPGQGLVFDWLATLGHPISEAYWAAVTVSGVPQLVLVQLFERRVLTYNPANPPAFQVEMGNVGRHYFDWRYAGASVGPAIVLEPPTGVGTQYGVQGWNWPAGLVHISATQAGTGASVPLGDATPDALGRFLLPLTLSPELYEQYQRAPQDVLVTARTDDGTQQTNLPLVVRPLPPAPTPVPLPPAPPPPVAPSPTLTPPPAPTLPPGERGVIVPLEGTIVSVDSAGGQFRLDIPENDVVLVQTDVATRITVRGSPGHMADLRPNQVVVVQAVRRPDAPDGTLVYRALEVSIP
jgi:hypothetical protein